VTESNAPVIYHKKNPTFFDEVKINLPPVVSADHHILFVFSHIFCQPKSKKDPTLDGPLGFAAIPLVIEQK
jgi:hypothetical protein